MLDYLCRQRFIRPSASSSRGRGRPRLFTFGDVVTLRVIARLLRSGVEVRRLSRGLRTLRDRLGEDASESYRYVVCDGVDVFLREGDTLEALTQGGQLAFAFLVDLQICRTEIAAALAAEKQSAAS